jgi:hypothetical protein
MPVSEAKLRANRANAQKSTGPKTEEGKAASRANAYKHGLTATKVLTEVEADEVRRRFVTFHQQIQSPGEVGQILTLRAATLSCRLERCVEYENVVLTQKVRQAEADFVPPEGLDPAEVAKLRTAAGRLALFDTSKEAALARKYEAATERSFFRCLKELQLMARAEKEAMDERNAERERMSVGLNFSEAEMDAELDAIEREIEALSRQRGGSPPTRPIFSTSKRGFEVPIAVGKPG